MYSGLTRRSVLMTGAAAVAFGNTGSDAGAQQPKKGGTLNFAISAETPHYDNHGSDTYATLHFAAPFYSTLLRFNLDKFPEVQGDLADKWDVAPDLMTYTFKLHPRVKFHDGQELTSADVKASYDRMRNPPQGVISTRQATFADIGTIETPDPLTVIFKMKNVNAAMLEHFASPWNTIYSAKDLAADPAAPRTKINGTGPFIFVDDVRVRRALLMAIDRWGGSQGLSRISTLRSVGGVIRPGSPMATPEAELVQLPGFSKDIKKSREEAKKLLAEAGVPNLKLQLWN